MVPEGKRHVVVILSRVHPGESPASYVCQGKLIRYLVESQIDKSRDTEKHKKWLLKLW